MFDARARVFCGWINFYSWEFRRVDTHVKEKEEFLVRELSILELEEKL